MMFAKPYEHKDILDRISLVEVANRFICAQVKRQFLLCVRYVNGIMFSILHQNLLLPGKDERGEKSKEINYRSIMAFREIGKGHSAIKTFAAVMNMPHL